LYEKSSRENKVIKIKISFLKSAQDSLH